MSYLQELWLLDPATDFRDTSDLLDASALEEISDGTFEGLPDRQGFDLIPGHGGVEPDAALGRTQAVAVAGPVAFEDLSLAVIHPDRMDSSMSR